MAGTTFSAASWSGYDEQSATNPASSLTDFTLLIDVSDLSASFGSAVQSDGADIRITKGDGTTELAYDLIDWEYNSGSPTGLIRVLWSGSLATSGTQNVRIWAGYTPGTAVAYSASETYGSDNAYDADWVAYWTFDSGTNSETDRTSNSLVATGIGTVTSATGKVGGASAITSYFESNANIETFLDTDNDFSILTWTKGSDADGDNKVLFQLRQASPVSEFNCYLDGGKPRIFVKTATSGFLITSSTIDVTDDTWHHVAQTFDMTGNATQYVDGSLDIFRDITSAGDSSILGSKLRIQSSQNDTDEFQVHSTVRTADWLAEEYTQTNDNTAFWGTWAWTDNAIGDDLATTQTTRLGAYGVPVRNWYAAETPTGGFNAWHATRTHRLIGCGVI